MIFSFSRNIPIVYHLSTIFSISILFTLFHFTYAATFEIVNQCNHTVWAATVSPAGGRRLDSGQMWVISATTSSPGRIWGRTNCSFNSNGRGGRCETGDCNGLLECQTNSNNTPTTLVEFSINQFNGLDFFDISLIDGFNIPMAMIPTGTADCRGVSCAAAAGINEECPRELRAPGGCNNPCTVFKTNEYCCTNGSGSCGPTSFSSFFKERCPDAYSYPRDDATSTFTCPGGTNYRVLFCPRADQGLSQKFVYELHCN